MANRSLKVALAATALTLGATAHAASPVRSGTPVADAEQIFGGSELVPVAIFMAAILAIMVFAADDDDSDIPTSP